MKRKIINAVLLVVMLAAMLSGCGLGGLDAAALVKGNMDLIYLNEYTADYLNSVGLTAEAADEEYDIGIEAEAQYFANYFEIDLDLCGEEITDKIEELYREIYTGSRYEIGSATRNEDAYIVSVTIYPIDIIAQFADNSEDFANGWSERLYAGEFNAMTDAEYEIAWAEAIIDAVSAYLPSIGYLDAEDIAVQVVEDESDGKYAISENDWNRIDALIIAY